MNFKKNKEILFILLIWSIAYGSCNTEVTSNESRNKQELKDQASLPSVSLINDTIPSERINVIKEKQKGIEQDTLPPIPLNPYQLKKNTAANFIKINQIDQFEVPIHLTGAFAWSSEQAQKAIYKQGNRPPLLIKELYPGILYYSKWVQHHPNSKNRSREADRLEYYDENGVLVKSFNVDNNNPYLQKHPDLVNHFYHAEGGMVAAEDQKADRKIHFRNSTTSVHVDQNTGFTQINYTLYRSNKAGNIIDFITTFLVIDTLGKEVNRLVDEELYINDTYVTPDGRFLALCTGGMEDINDFGQEINRHQAYGIRIYDLEDMQLIYKTESKYINGVSGFENESKYIYYRSNEDENDSIYFGYYNFIDPYKKLQYSRLFTLEEDNAIYEKSLKSKGMNREVSEILKSYTFLKRKF